MEQQNITVRVNENMMSFFVTMFSVLSRQETPFDLGLVDDQFVRIPRNPDDVVKFNFDKDKLKTKVLGWIGTSGPPQQIAFDTEESEIFRKCAHAAYYFITESFDNQGLAENYVKIYTSIFGNPSQ